MKIYLDIDGTLLQQDHTAKRGQAAAGLEEFLVALRPYDTYWLTTHCTDGDPTRAREIMKRVLPDALHPDIDRIKGTVWNHLKTEALDWSSDFIWFDDNIFASEWEVLAQGREQQSAIQVDLRNNPEQLLEIVRDVL